MSEHFFLDILHPLFYLHLEGWFGFVLIFWLSSLVDLVVGRKNIPIFPMQRLLLGGVRTYVEEFGLMVVKRRRGFFWMLYTRTYKLLCEYIYELVGSRLL